MRFSSAHGFMLAALTSASALGCSPMADENIFVPPDVLPATSTIAFDDAATLKLAPGEARTIAAHAAPGDESYHVRFALIGEALDASLDQAEVDSDKDGATRVTLHASTRPATFRLRATILDEHSSPVASAEVSVSVSAQGFGSVRVLPQYAGTRPVKGWTASLVAGRTCASLASTLPDDPAGALTASTPTDEPVLVSGAPVGPNLAVAVRSRRYLVGCADAVGLAPDATLEVTVPVFDEPLQVDATDVAISLAFTPEEPAYAALFAGSTDLLVGAFSPASASEAALLLDGMAAQAADPSAFAERRKASAWDAAVKQHLVALGEPLGERLGAWVTTGLAVGPREIAARLQATSSEIAQARLTLTRVTGVDAMDADITPAQPATLAASPDDTLVFAGDVAFRASRFAAAAALLGARQEGSAITTMGDALAHAADCGGLASALQGYGACDATCMEGLCRAALTARFELAESSASASSQIALLHVDAAGPASISDDATPIGLKGAWLGSLSVGASSIILKGPVTGTPWGAPMKP